MDNLLRRISEDSDSFEILSYLQEVSQDEYWNMTEEQNKERNGERVYFRKWYWKAKTCQDGKYWEQSDSYFNNPEDALADFLSKVRKFTLHKDKD